MTIKRQRNGIAFAGNLIVDQIKFIQNYPAPHTLTTITGTERSVGGLVCNCIVDMAKLDDSIPLKAIGLVGNDDMGEYILSELGQYPSIDTSGIIRKGETSFTDVMTLPDGGRTFFQYRGANALLAPEHFNFSGLNADILHIGYVLLLDTLDGPDPDYPTALCRVLHNAQKAGIKTSVDVVSEESTRFSHLVPPALQYSDFCIINEIEAQRTTGITLRKNENSPPVEDNFKPCLEKLAELGVKKWVVIHMPEMSCGLDVKSGKYVCLPSFPLPKGFIKSSVGAGDAFASGVLLGAYRGWDIEKSLYCAAAVAAYSLSGSGASDSLKDLESILAEMNSFE